MSPLVLGAAWVIAAAGVAMLPMRRQMVPGLCLLIAAPMLLIWIGVAEGWPWAAFGVFAFGSMFRRPLIYLFRKTMGLPVADPRRGQA